MKVVILSLSLLCSAAFTTATKVTCQPDDSLIPNPDDCSTYYNCDNGVPKLSNCPPTLHFNPEVLVCDRPENVNCQVSTVSPATTTTQSPATTTTEAPETISTEAPTTTTTEAPATISTEAPTTTTTEAIPDTTNEPDSTTSEPTSTTGEPTTSTTRRPTSTQRPTTSTTSRPTTSTTSQPTDTTTEQPDSTTEQQTTLTPEEPETTTITISTTTEASNGCPASGSGIIANPEECSSFIVCINGANTTVSCPSGMQFNEALNACDLDENVICGEEITTTSEPEATTTSEPETEKPTTIPPSTTTEAPRGCPPTGNDVIANPEDCGSFLVCINGDSITVPCPSGMQFDEELKICDKEENVQCGNQEPTEEPTTPSAEETTTPSAEETTTENNELTTEGDDTTTEGEETTTGSEETTTGSEETTTGSDELTTGSEETTTGSEETTTESIESTTTGEDNTTQSQPTTIDDTNNSTTEQPGFQPECPPEGYEIIENPENCSSFYVCVNGVSGLVNCPAGFDFNPETVHCDLPADPNCRAGVTEPPTTPDTYVPPCPENGTIQLPNPSDCSSFYICINGNYARLTCPENFSFNETTQSCVRSDASTCSVVNFYTIPLFECEENGNFPDPEDCGKYYTCDGDQVFHQDCPGGLHFDSTLGTCNTPQAAQCEVGTTSDTPTPTPTDHPTTPSPTPSSTTTPSPPTTTDVPSTTTPNNDSVCPSEGTIILPNPDDCTKFIVCINGDYDIVDCPEGYGWSEQLQSCDLLENVDCTPPSLEPKCPPSGTAKLPNPADCTSYYYCINGHAALINCPIGLNYDEDLEVCSATAECSTGTPKPTTSDPTTPTVTQKPTTSSTDSPSTVTSSTQKPTTGNPTTSEPTTNNPAKCEVDGELVPNPSDCSSFLQCANGVLVKVDCPPGLEFNADLSVCDNPENANCKSNVLMKFLQMWN